MLRRYHRKTQIMQERPSHCPKNASQGTTRVRRRAACTRTPFGLTFRPSCLRTSAFFTSITIVGRELHFLDATCAIINFKYTVLVYPPALSLPFDKSSPAAPPSPHPPLAWRGASFQQAPAP